MGNRVFITGSTGFIGSHLVEACLRRGDEVRCLIRKTSNKRWLEGLDVHYHTGEIVKKESLEGAFRDIDIVYHLASLTKALRPEQYYQVNTEGTRNVLEVCQRENPGLKRFVLVSSLAAAGPSPSETPIDETWPPEPITDYGKSKLEAEKIAAKFQDRLPITIVRPPAVYGPRDHDVYLQFRMIRKGWLFFVGRQDQLVSLVYAPDLAGAMIELAECEKARGRTYFVSNPKPYRWSEVSSEIARALKKEKLRKVAVPLVIVDIIARMAGGIAFLTRKPALLNRQKMIELRQPCWACRSSRLERDTGFSCPTTLEQGISKTARWYLENGWL